MRLGLTQNRLFHHHIITTPITSAGSSPLTDKIEIDNFIDHGKPNVQLDPPGLDPAIAPRSPPASACMRHLFEDHSGQKPYDLAKTGNTLDIGSDGSSPVHQRSGQCHHHHLAGWRPGQFRLRRRAADGARRRHRKSLFCLLAYHLRQAPAFAAFGDLSWKLRRSNCSVPSNKIGPIDLVFCHPAQAWTCLPAHRPARARPDCGAS